MDATNTFVDIFPCAYTYLTGEQLSGILDRTLNHDLSFPKATELKFTQSKSTVGSWFNDNRESRYSVFTPFYSPLAPFSLISGRFSKELERIAAPLLRFYSVPPYSASR